MESFIINYGYLAILAGCFFEGEIVMIAGGLLAHQGLLDLRLVFLFGFLGTLISDQFYFWMGRIHGQKFLSKRPHINKKIDFAHKGLKKYGAALAVCFRFLYGFRILVPVVAGTSEMKAGLFIILNMTGIIMWAVAMGMVGYAVSGVLENSVGRVKTVEIFILIFAIIAGIAAWIIRLNKIKKNNKKHVQVNI